jgi:hypothetical protein
METDQNIDVTSLTYVDDATNCDAIQRTNDAVVVDHSESVNTRRRKRRKVGVVLVNGTRPMRICSRWIPHLLTTLFVAIFTLGGTQTTEAQQQRRIDPLLLEEYCKNFTHGNPSALEFYSPMYPKDYPADITCFRTITADFGYFVRIDFRDAFRIEPPSNEGNCDYDYLEIRDGDQGYSPLIGKIMIHS